MDKTPAAILFSMVMMLGYTLPFVGYLAGLAPAIDSLAIMSIIVPLIFSAIRIFSYSRYSLSREDVKALQKST